MLAVSAEKREGAPQHCATPINKVVKGHLWRHSYSPEGDSASVSRTHNELKCVCVQLDIAKRFLSTISLKWETSASWCASALWFNRNAFANIPGCQLHLESSLLFLMFHLMRWNRFPNRLQKHLPSSQALHVSLFFLPPVFGLLTVRVSQHPSLRATCRNAFAMM